MHLVDGRLGVLKNVPAIQFRWACLRQQIKISTTLDEKKTFDRCAQ